jgi:uncharacterized repeat protein (TIGR01451 family)
VASASEVPEIWTSKEMYVAGEAAVINGTGFVSGTPVDIVITYSGELMFAGSSAVIDGAFGNADYIVPAVEDTSIPFLVVASQSVYGLEATTFFYEPPLTIWHQAWDAGEDWWQKANIRGYNEADSIPWRILVTSDGSPGYETVSVVMAFDRENLPSGAIPYLGFDFLTHFDQFDVYGDPIPPFNIYPISSTPFSLSPTSEGQITSQVRIDDLYLPAENKVQMRWQFTIEFDPAHGDVAPYEATVWCGAHLAVTALPVQYGASHYPGASLHGRIDSTDPWTDPGNADLPVDIRGVFMPPNMELAKECDPTVVAKDDTISFSLMLSNLGEAQAMDIDLEDVLPSVLSINPTSFTYRDTADSTPRNPVPYPTVIDPQHFEWNDIETVTPGTSSFPGTDAYPGGFYAWLDFTATVIGDMPGWYQNWAELTYSDVNSGLYPPETATCSFQIVKPEIHIEKFADRYCAEVGETVEYWFVIQNPSMQELDVCVWDPLIKPFEFLSDPDWSIELEDPLWTGVLGPKSSRTLTSDDIPELIRTVVCTDPDPLENTVTVRGEDNYGNVVWDSYTISIDILYPDILLEKFADKSCAAVGEVVTYWFVVSNPGEEIMTYKLWDPLIKPFDESNPLWSGTLMPDCSETVDVSKVPALAYTVKVGDGDPLVNHAFVKAWDYQNHEVLSEDCWEVDVRQVAIAVEKVADKYCAAEGEVIIFTITVENVGTLGTDIVFDLSDGLVGLYLTGVPLPAGCSMVLTGDQELGDMYPDDNIYYYAELCYVVTCNEDDPFVNTVTVFAYDDQYIEGDRYADLHSQTVIVSTGEIDKREVAIEVTQTRHARLRASPSSSPSR